MARDETKVQFNMRVGRRVAEALKAAARRQRISPSALARSFVEEGVRSAQYPGIDFRLTPSGRQPHLTGTGLTVWEVRSIWRDHEGDLPRMLRHYPDLPRRLVETALAYARAFAEEAPPEPAIPGGGTVGAGRRARARADGGDAEGMRSPGFK